MNWLWLSLSFVGGGVIVGLIIIQLIEAFFLDIFTH